jgi:hypothetical protein
MKGAPRTFTPLAIAVAVASLLLPWPAHAGGTHGLIQLQGGFAASPADDMGLSLGYGLAAGYGGRVRGSLFRLYGLVAFDRAAFTGSGVHEETGRPWTAERSFNDLQAGLRVLLPVFYRLRWYIEAMAGASLLTGSICRVGGRAVVAHRWGALISAATGLEVRYADHFATGVRVEVRWIASGGEAIPLDLGQARVDDHRISVLATQAFLF